MADYDIIIIGSGPGGGTMALELAPTGKRILLLERGDYLKRERANWSSQAVFVDGKYQCNDVWHDREGNSFHPGLHYVVGGNSKVYGGSLYRLRLEDFGELQHEEGVSPAWPVGYDVFEPYYTRAERLFQVHGTRGADPTEPWASAPYPHPAVRHEPRIQALADGLTRIGHHPYPQPLAILLDEDEQGAKPHSPCIRCDAFDGYPCLTNGKADAQIVAVDPAREYPNVTLLTGAYVERLETDASGRTVTGVHVVRGGVEEVYRADIVVVAAGALSSALLMLRSASDAHPNGLANGSGLVGRNYMRHNNSAFMAVSLEPNDTVFQKTLALSDFYFGADDYAFPLGEIQMIGKSHGDQVKAEGLSTLAVVLPQLAVRPARPPQPRLLGDDRGPAAPRQPHLLPGREGHPRRPADGGEAAPAAAPQARGAARQDRRPPAPAAAIALPWQGRRDRRDRAPGRHDGVRGGPGDVGARPELPRARGRQPLRDRRGVLPVDRGGQPDADDHRQRDAGRGSPEEPDGVRRRSCR